MHFLYFFKHLLSKIVQKLDFFVTNPKHSNDENKGIELNLFLGILINQGEMLQFSLSDSDVIKSGRLTQYGRYFKPVKITFNR